MSGMIDVDRLLFGKQAQQTSSHDGNNQQVDGPMLNENIALLTRQWRNEVHAPEILPYRQDLMDDVIEILKTQIQNIDKMKVDSLADSFAITFYRMEADRVKYSVSRYLRARLLKIEQQADFIEEHDVVKDRLSIKERVFVEQLVSLNTQHFKATVHDGVTNDGLRRQFAKRADIIAHATPNLDEFVICLAMEDMNDVMVSADEIFPIGRGETCVLQYAKIRNHVEEGRCILI